MEERISIKPKSLIVLLLLLLSRASFSQAYKDHFFQTTFSMGPVFSLYKGNSNHMSSPKPKAAFNANAKFYFRFNKVAFLFVGVNYLTHGNSFNSYYFPDSTLRLYDKEFLYNYSSRYQDVSFPLGIHIKFAENKERHYCIYGELGWAMKRRFASTMDVVSNKYGNSVYYDVAGNTFNSRFKSKKTGSSLLMTFGFDKNFHDKHSGFFIEVNLAYGINKFNYAYNKNFPGSLYQNEKFIALNAGIRF